MTGNQQLTTTSVLEGGGGRTKSKEQIMTDCDNSTRRSNQSDNIQAANRVSTEDGQGQTDEQVKNSSGEQYWRLKYEQLKNDFNHLQQVNQNLEDKLLNIVETFEKKREELVASVEYEKSTLMADVNKLSTKLVDARIKLHDFEEKEILHAAECSAPCHKSSASSFSSHPQAIIPSISSSYNSGNGGTSSSSNNNSYGIRFDPHQTQQMANDPNLV